MGEKRKKSSLFQIPGIKSPIWSIYFLITDVLLPPLNGPLRTALVQPLWFSRSGDKTLRFDAIITVLVGLYQHGLRKPDWIIITLLEQAQEWVRLNLRFLDWIAEHRVMELQIFSLLVLLAIFAGAIALRGEAPPVKAKVESLKRDDYLLPPLLLPGKTTHTRLFPQKHSFEYSYFSVGIPVGFKGRAGSVLSANLDLLEPGQRGRGWFNVNASDYLYRGDSERGLEERLRHYLRREGVSDDAWSFAYLVTAPKFLGYSFNPVSFWYIYDSSKQLNMMVLEVNNTFGERRLYLLKSQRPATEDSQTPDGEETPAKAIKFTNAWVKDFHVSPFNSRKGTYSLTATDPLTSLRTGEGIFLDNLIVLNSSKAHAKLIARVFSVGEPKDPFTISTFELAKILGAWFWVGFMTSPRILTQAWILYFKRGLNIWLRPEILSTSLGRAHTSSEGTLETYFKTYISSLVQKYPEPLKVTYIPPGSMGSPTIMLSDPEATEIKDLELKILTPAFYSRLPHHSHTTEAFNREGLCTEEKNRTILISNPQYLSMLLAASPPPAVKPNGVVEKLRWTALWRLRCPPPATAYPVQTNPGMQVSDIRAPPPSDLDRFVLSSGDASLYRRTCVKLFIASRMFLGFDGVVDLLDWVIRIAIVVLSFSTASLGGEKYEGGNGAVVGRLGRLGLVTGLHVWGWIKGTW